MYRQCFAGRIVWLDPAGDPTACAKMAESIDSGRWTPMWQLGALAASRCYRREDGGRRFLFLKTKSL